MLFAKNKIEQLGVYAFETLMLMNLSRIIINILASRHGGQERASLVMKFFSTIKKSSLLESGE